MLHLRNLHAQLIIGAFAFASSPATAVPITEPGDLDAPTDLIDFNAVTNPVADPMLFASSIGNVVITNATNAINTDGYGASIAFPDYVSGMALGRPDSAPAFPNFTIIFPVAVAQVGFGLFDPNFENPDNMIRAYYAGFNLLEQTTPDALFPPGGCGADYLGFSRATADIMAIEIIASPGDALWIDNLEFSVTPANVPAPAALMMMGMRLLVLARYRKR